jgi:hypothetical protein
VCVSTFDAVIFEVLKALMLRIQVFCEVAVTGSFIPEEEDDDSAIRQNVRNQ